MSDRTFIDTNIWVYAHLNEQNNPKCNCAVTILENLPVLTSSTRVLSEYYAAMLKNKIADNLIQDYIDVIINIAEIQEGLGF